jgi:basic membrane protein A and related proteins
MPFGRAGTAILALLLVNAGLLLAGLSKGKPQGKPGQLRIGLVFDVGGLGDRSFNDAAFRGLKQAEEAFAGTKTQLETRYIEPGDGADRESAIRQLAADGFDLVIGVGFIFTDDMRGAAAQYPKTKFACIDYSVIPGQSPPTENLVGLRFREEEGSFLVGALAGLKSKSKKVGFVGGMQIPLIRKFEAGFTAGVKQVCPECEVLAAYAGTEPKAFADPTTGKELALSQYNRGADVIFHASGKTGAGVFTAARELGRWAIGVDSDQHSEAPCCILTSMVKGVDVVVFETIKELARGEWLGGVREFGLKEQGVDYIFDDRNRERIGALHDDVELLREEIIAGRIVVPSL